MPAIIVKNYEHFNRSFGSWDTPKGVYVKNKDHYERLMREQGMISQEQASGNSENKNLKPYILNDKTRKFISEVKLTADSKGRVKLGQKAVEQLVKMKAIGNQVPAYMQLPAHYK